MQYKEIFRTIGLVLMLFSLSMVPPMVINLVFSEHIWLPFCIPFIVLLSLGSALWFRYKQHKGSLYIREGFFIVTLLWFSVCFFGSLPFIFYTDIPHTFTDNVFETVSGITTTGAVCFTNIDQLPHAIMYYRQQLQFIGGMGIVILAVAIFPMLGMGGMNLFKVESAGPIKDIKLTPRIAQTAKTLWSIYLLMTIICALSYWYFGMNWFDALGESFGTVSTGGLSMHDENFGFYKSQAIELVACVFMFIGALNFTLHYIAFQLHSFKVYWRNEEFRSYLCFFLFCTLLIIIMLSLYEFFQKTPLQFLDALFMVISASTTTGFVLHPFDHWPTFVPILMILMSVVGGCSGSASGGFKLLRVMLITKQSKREFIRSLHPQAALTVKMDHQTVAENILQSTTVFFVIYVGLYILLLLGFMALGNDFLSSFSIVAAGLSNTGTGIGAISDSFVHISDASKWLLILAMIIGRLEIFPLLILFTRTFWQK